MTRFDETWHRLREWTNGQTSSERLAAQILLDSGFKNLNPIHPLGGPDGGKDATVENRGEPWIMAVYFPRDQQSHDVIEKKFINDFEGVRRNDAQGMAFVTNQELTDSKRHDLAAAVAGPVDIFHLERITTILDQPHMAGVRKQFLDIDLSSGLALDRSKRLEELKRASLARCVQRWRAVGLPDQEARALAENHAVGMIPGELRPNLNRPVVVWTAKIGAGKSIAAERVHQAALEFALEEPQGPIPIFLHARRAVDGLEQVVKDHTREVGEPREQGAMIVIDGLDEVGQELAKHLLSESRVLIDTWPKTSVLLVSRPLSLPLDPDEHEELPELSESESQACVELGAGREITYGEMASFPVTVKETLRQPLFALLTGLWMRKNNGSPRAPVDLMAELGKSATPEDADLPLLRRLAVESVRRDLSSVPVSEVAKPAQVQNLLATGIVIEQENRVLFALPALAQWFAAEALLEGEVEPKELLAVAEDLELWLYPVALGISFGSDEDAKRILRPLLDSEPGFAFRVLDTAFKQAVMEGAPAPPWREAGRKTRDALLALLNSVSPLGPLLVDSNTSGELAPMAVATEDSYLTVAFSWDKNSPEISKLPPGTHPFRPGPKFGTIRGSRVGPGGTWAWRWSRDVIKDGFKQLLKSRGFPVPPEGPLADEEVWDCATEIANKSPLVCARLELDPLIERIASTVPADFDPPRVVSQNPGRQAHDLIGVLSYLLRMRREGKEVLEPPIPSPNRWDGDGWIGELYTEDRLVEAARVIYLQAIQAYTEIVNRWLPQLAPQLEHWTLLPIRVVARLNPGRGPGWEGIPSLAGYLEALPSGAQSEVDVVLDKDRYDYSLAEGNWEAQKTARPHAGRWLRGIHGGMTFEVGHRRPVADAVYKWLADDLQRLGLADSLDHSASQDAMTLWDLTERSWRNLVAQLQARD